MNKGIKWLMGGLLVIAAGYALIQRSETEPVGKVGRQVVEEKIVYEEIVVGGEKLRVEVADTPAKITKGLGYRDELGSDGMIFVFPTAHIPAFWMKGMRFGLDFVWIECKAVNNEQRTENKKQKIMSNGVSVCKVVDVTEKVEAPDDPENPEGRYSPKSQVTHVLEVDYGWIEERGIDVGDEVGLR